MRQRSRQPYRSSFHPPQPIFLATAWGSACSSAPRVRNFRDSDRSWRVRPIEYKDLGMTTETAAGLRNAVNGAVPDAATQQPNLAAPFVPQPQTVEESGLDFSFVLDLVVKAIYFGGRPVARQIAAQLALSFPIIDEALTFIKREQFAEVVGSSGMGEQLYQYSLSAKGLEKAEEALARNQYIGPAPVPFETYVEVLRRQAVSSIRITPETVENAISHLVLDEKVATALGPAVNSGRSMLLYG